MKVRIRFRKYGAMKFIGHLDIMRYFQKAMRRAEIPIAFTGGYSPHMVMSFANPLGVGVTSDGEYFDIELKESISSEAAIRALNDVMVEGMGIVSFKELGETDKTGMSIVAGAAYESVLTKGSFPADLEAKLLDFMNQEEIVVLKKSKKTEREVDIKPLIYKLEAKESHIEMQVAAGSVDNLKPGQVMDALAFYLGMDKEQITFAHHRIDMYAHNGQELISMDSIGSDIL